jgi:hypothetical protein
MNIDFSGAPSDPVERLVWLSGAREVLDAELSNAWQVAYFEARMSGRIDQALALKLHARKRVLAFTRAENERRGRVIRAWGDGN